MNLQFVTILFDLDIVWGSLDFYEAQLKHAPSERIKDLDNDMIADARQRFDCIHYKAMQFVKGWNDQVKTLVRNRLENDYPQLLNVYCRLIGENSQA